MKRKCDYPIVGYKKRLNGLIDIFKDNLYSGSFWRTDSLNPYYNDFNAWVEKYGEPKWSPLQSIEDAKSTKLIEISAKKDIFQYLPVSVDNMAFASTGLAKDQFFAAFSFRNASATDTRLNWPTDGGLVWVELSYEQILKLAETMIEQTQSANLQATKYLQKLEETDTLDQINEIIVEYGSK